MRFGGGRAGGKTEAAVQALLQRELEQMLARVQAGEMLHIGAMCRAGERAFVVFGPRDQMLTMPPAFARRIAARFRPVEAGAAGLDAWAADLERAADVAEAHDAGRQGRLQ